MPSHVQPWERFIAFSPLRATGRTTRMLDEAARLSREGRAVYVLCADAATAALFRGEFVGRHAECLDVKFETPESLGPGFDWRTLTLRGAHPNCVVLIDHYTIESRYGPLLEMLHRFDAPAEATT